MSQTTNKQSSKSFVGIDVAKSKYDVATHDSKTVVTFAATKEGQQKLLAWLRLRGVELVCIEATGNYQHTLVQLLHQHGYQLAVVNPRLPRDFARAMNLLAKTDAIDARVLALFAQKMQPRATPRESPTLEQLSALVTRRDQLVAMRTQEKNRLETAFQKASQQSLEKHLRYLETSIEELETELAQLVATEPELQATAKLLTSTPGIGRQTATKLIAELPELGKLNRQEIARLVGVAPINRDSGTMRGHRTTGGGRASVRKSLYMPTIVALKYNPTIQAFYQRLVASGKPKMVALIAAMRKLLTILNQILKTKSPWQSPQTN